MVVLPKLREIQVRDNARHILAVLKEALVLHPPTEITVLHRTLNAFLPTTDVTGLLSFLLSIDDRHLTAVDLGRREGHDSSHLRRNTAVYEGTYHRSPCPCRPSSGPACLQEHNGQGFRQRDSCQWS